MTCRKRRFRSKDDAAKAAHSTRRAHWDYGYWRAYRCATCRYPDRQRAWHWGHAIRGRTP